MPISSGVVTCIPYEKLNKISNNKYLQRCNQNVRTVLIKYLFSIEQEEETGVNIKKIIFP